MSAGKASICHWDLRARFFTKEQAVKAIKLLLEEDIDFDIAYSVEMGDSLNRTAYIIDIDGMSWANNLETVAQILKEVDHKYE
jgi:hypothetical protein